MLQRIRTLSVQSANGTNTTDDRASIQAEVDQLSAEITRIACKTTFGGHQILAGANKGLIDADGKVKFQVGANANDTISVNLNKAFSIVGMDGAVTKTGGLTIAEHDGIKTFSVSTADNAQATLGDIDKFIALVDKTRGELGAVQNRLESTIKNQSNIAENESDARSRIRDTDYAEEAANMSQQTIIQQAAASMLTQANSRPQIALSLLG